MADTKISALTAASVAAAANEFAINEAGTSKKVTAAQLATYLRTVGMTQVKNLASDEVENETASMVKVTGLDLAVGTGTYVFEYYIRARSFDTVNSMKFAVNHTGTADVFNYFLYFPSAGVTAATGAVDQESNPTTGSVWAFAGTRVKNTTLGPQASVDTADADILYRISGMMIVTVAGNLELYHGSELTQTAGTLVKAGSCLILTKVA